MKKVLSGFFAMVFMLSSCVVFAEGSADATGVVKASVFSRPLWTDYMPGPPPAQKGSDKEVIVELSSSEYSWRYSVDNEDMVKLVSKERISFMGAWDGIMPPPAVSRWHFEPLKEGDVTITFTAPPYCRYWNGEHVDGRKISYTYHIDSELNMERVSTDEVTLPSPLRRIIKA